MAEEFNGEFRTDNLGLAAFLELLGHTHQYMELRSGRKVVWVFDRDNGLEAEVLKFRRRVAVVEPIEYQNQLTAARNDMFAFLDEQNDA